MPLYRVDLFDLLALPPRHAPQTLARKKGIQKTQTSTGSVVGCGCDNVICEGGKGGRGLLGGRARLLIMHKSHLCAV